MTENFRKSTTRRSIALEARHVEALRRTVDRLRLEIAELRASRERVVLAADADRRAIERDLHDGVQQHLVALAANLEFARRSRDADPEATRARLDDMARDVQQALHEAGKLAHRIYPPLLDAGGLAAALRAAAAILGVPTRIEVAADGAYPSEIAGTVYFCCLDLLERADEGAHATITVPDEERELVFEIAVDAAGSAATASGDTLERLQDRVEALGGRLTIRSDPDHGTRVAGSLPLSR